MGIERLAVLAPSLFVRLQIRYFPSRLTDFGSRRGRIGKTPGELLADEAMLRVALPVDVERELDERAKALLARSESFLAPLSLSNIAHQAQQTSTRLKPPGMNLDWEAGPILASVAGLEG